MRQGPGSSSVWAAASTSIRRVGVVAVVAVVGCGIALGFVFERLLERVQTATERSEKAGAVVETVLRLDGLEWRAVAGQPIEDLRADFEEHAARLDQLSLQSDQDELAAQVGLGAAEYVGAVRAEFDALSVGDDVLARQIDSKRVDPTFDAVLEAAEALVGQERASAATAARTTEQLAWATVASIVFLAASGLGFLLRQRERRVVESQRTASAQRFRSLVEGSSDVITIISGEGQLVVMSPGLGFLGAIASTLRPTHISDLLPVDGLHEWSEFDTLVRAGQTVEGLEMQLLRHDGSLADVELIGRPLLGEPGHRVWVWRDVSQRKSLESELTRLAFHDSLTGVANRALLLDRTDHALRRAERSEEAVCVLLCDLDGFKAVNDSLGHNHGDEFLKAIATRMAGCLRQGDTLARLGGDEFAVLLEKTDIALARQIADRILTAVAQQLELAERPIFPTMSIGLAAFERGVATEELLRRADVAMYDAKRAGKARTAVYRHGLTHQDADGLLMHTELRRAVHNGDLTLVYQPTVSLSDGSVSSVEALARWTHPTLGPIPPTTFIPMAEESGTIVALGKWVLTEACRAAVALCGSSGQALTMHVNLSPHQLNDPDLVPFVKQTIADTGLDPQLLVLEITEGALLASSTAIDRLVELHGHGVRLAIDDFGTGYASITYLRQLPIDILKIDRAFVSGDALPPGERHAFLNTIINMAHNLHVTAVAEGIETDVQRQEVAQLGCDQGQGYLWARPVDIDSLRRTIHALGSTAKTVKEVGPQQAEPQGEHGKLQQ